MTHTNRPVLLLVVTLALTPAAPLTAQPPPRPEAPGGQERIQMPRRADGLSPARDRANAPEAVGTGRIRGRVVDDAGQPVRRAAVVTFSTQGRRAHAAQTDADGRYELTELTAGTYQLSASRGAYVRQSYGQRSGSGPGRPIELADGQTADKIDFVLSRGGVVVGRVVDELGEPMTDVNVQALRYTSNAGSPRLSPMGRNAQTDDLGQFRLFGLPPGEYIVSASSRGQMMFGPMAEVQSGENTGYAPTYSPGTPNAAEATRVQVQSGHEVNADVQLTAARMLRVSGVVVGSSGKPTEGGFVRLIPRAEMVFDERGLSSPLRGGSFRFDKVPPGNYTLSVRSTEQGFGPGPGRSRSGTAPDDTEFASVPITVAGEDLANLRVVTSRGLTVPGVVSSESGSMPTDQTIRVMIVPAGPDRMMTSRPSEVEASGRFQIDGVFGEGRLSVMGLGRGWMIKTVDYKGANVTDRPIEFAADGGPVRVVITNRIPIVTGAVTSSNGMPLTDYEVLIFTTDTSQWDRPGRHIRTVRADQQGTFKAEALPPGDYYIAAFSSLDEDSRTSAETLQRARTVAQEITLAEGQTRAVSLKLSVLPQ
jgi:Carboxypeptidase regulatory-like domain